MSNQPTGSSETEPKEILNRELKQKIYLKRAAKLSLLVLLIAITAQFVSIYQTEHNLNSPIIPKGLVWEISRQFIFMAFVFTASSVVGLIFYFYDKYLWVIILVLLTLIASRYIYLPV